MMQTGLQRGNLGKWAGGLRLGWQWRWQLLGIVLVILIGGTVFPQLAQAQEQNPTPTAERNTAAPEKALKYHSALVRRPSPGYLFDRFYGAWLEAATTAELEKFLKEQVAAKTTAAAASGSSDEVTVARLLLAFFYSKRGDDVWAMAELESVVAADDSNPTAWYELARARARLLDFAGAVTALEKAAQAQPEDALALEVEKLRGRLLVRAGDSAAALKVWQDLLLANPDDDELAEELIEAQLDEGLLEEAILASEALVERTRDAYLKVQRRLRTGDLYGRAENSEKALAAYGEALAQTGANTWIERQALAQIERLFRRQDDLEGLKRFYTEAGQDLRRRLQVQLGEAQLLANLGETDASLTAWREILRQTPGDRSLRERFVQVLVEAEQFDEALTQVTALTELHPLDGELFALRAEVELSANRKTEAVASLRRYLEMSGEQGSEGLWVRVAKRLEAAEMLDEAEVLLKQAIERWPQGMTVREEYAALLHRTDKRELALTEWRALADESALAAGGGQASADEEAAVCLRVARALMARGEGEVALEVLLVPLTAEGEADLARRAKFFEHAGYLPALADAAERGGDFAQAARWAKEHLLRVARPDELPTAVERVGRMMRKAGSLQAEIARLEKEAKSAVQQCLLAELLEVSGAAVEADSALNDFEKTLADDDAVAADLIAAQRVRLLRLRRDWISAAEVTESMLGDGREGLRSSRLRTMVELLARAGDVEAVMKWLPEWKKASPGSTAPWMEESRILQQAGRVSDAIQVLRQAVQRFDGDEPLRVRLAELYASNGDRADAERLFWQLYESAEKADEKISWASRLAELAEDGGSVPQLVEKFEERRKANRNSPIPLLALAAVYRMTDEYEKRREVLLDATRLRPDDVGLLRVIAGIEREEGEIERARRTLQSAVELDDSKESLRQLARFELEYGDADDGFRILEEMHREAGALSTGNAVDVARAMARGDHWQRIVDFLDPILEEKVESVELAWLRATALEELGRYDEAVAAFYQVLEAANAKSWTSSVGASARVVGSSRSSAIFSSSLPFSTRHHWAGAEFTRQRKMMLPPIGQLMLYDYEQADAAYAYRSWGGGPLPADRDELVSNVLIHLTLCGSRPTISRMEDRAARAEALGVEMALQRMLAIWDLQAMQARQYNRRRYIPYIVGPPVSVFERFADDAGVQSVRISGNIGLARYQVVELAELERIFALLEKDYPDVAFASAVDGLNRIFGRSDDRKVTAEECRALLQRAVESGMARQSASYVGLFDLGYQLGAWRSNNSHLPEDYREELRDVLVHWYQLSQGEPWAGVAASKYAGFSVLAATMLRGADKTPAIDLLENKLAADRAVGNATASNEAWSKMTAGSGFSHLEEPLSPMAYPPPELPGFSTEVAAMLVVPSLRASYDFENGIPGLPRERVAAVKDPLLRALLAWHGRFADVERAAYEELQVKPMPTVADLLMIAGKAAQLGDLLTSAQALTKVQSMPLAPAQRTAVDGALAVTVVELSAREREAAGEDYADLLAAGSAAALRFRQWAKDREQRLTLLGLLEDYGLDDEAERVQRQLDLGRQRMARAKAKSDLGMLIANGQRAEALRQAVRKVRAEAGQYSRTYQVNIDYQKRAFFDSLWVHGLRDDVLKQTHPGDSTSARRWFDYSFICFALEEEERSIEALERTLEIRPDHEFAVQRLVIMHATRASGQFDAEKFISAFRAARNANQLAGALSVVSSNFRTGDDGVLVHCREVVPAATAALRGPVGGAAEADCNWLSALRLLGNCQNSWDEAGFWLAPLNRIPNDEDLRRENVAEDTAAADGIPPHRGRLWRDVSPGRKGVEQLAEDLVAMKAAMAERRKIFDELAAVLAMRSDIAEKTFLLQLQVAEAQEEDPSYLEPLAWRVVAMNNEARQRARRGRALPKGIKQEGSPVQRMMFFENSTREAHDDNIARERQPEEFLIHQAAGRGDLAETLDKVVAAMEKAGASAPDIDAAKAYAALLGAADGEAFLAAAMSAITELPEPPRKPDAIDEEADDENKNKPRQATVDGVLAGVFDVWQERELKVDLLPLVSAYFHCKKESESNTMWVTDQMADWMATMRERDPGWLETFADAVAEDFFGPREGRELRLKEDRERYQLNEERRRQTANLPGAGLARFFGLFEAMTGQPGVAFAFSELIEERCPGIAAAEMLVYFRNDRQRSAWRRIVHGAGFNRAAEDFRCYLMEPESEHSSQTVMHSILHQVREDTGGYYERLDAAEWLDELDADSFGGGLVLSALQPVRYRMHQQQLPLSSYYALHLDEIRKAPLLNQRELAALATIEMRDHYANADLDRLGEVFEWARNFYRLPDFSELDALLELDSWDELKPLRDRDGFNEPALNFVMQRLPQLADADPAKAWAVMEKIEQLGPVNGADGTLINVLGLHGQPLTSLLKRVGSTKALAVALRGMITWDEIDREVEEQFDHAAKAQLVAAMADPDSAKRHQNISLWCDEIFSAMKFAQQGNSSVEAGEGAERLWVVFDSVLTNFLDSDRLAASVADDPFLLEHFSLTLSMKQIRSVDYDPATESLALEPLAERLRQWAEAELKKDPGLSGAATRGFAERVIVVSQLLASRELAIAEGDPELFHRVATEWLRPIVSLVESKDTPLGTSMRLWLSDRIALASGVPTLDAPATRAGVRAMADMWRLPWVADEQIEYEFDSSNLLAFARHDALQAAPGDPAWQEAGVELLDAWNSWMRHRSSPPGYGTVIAMTDIGLRRAKRGDDSGRLAAARTLRKYRMWVGNEPEMVSLLVSHGETDRAARFVAENWEEMSEGYEVARFSASTVEHLPAFLQSFEDDPDLRYYAELLVSLAPDLVDSEGVPVTEYPPRRERIADLARRFSEVEFGDADLRRRSLEILLNQDGSREALEPVIVEEWKKIHWTGLGHCDSDEAFRVASLMAHRLQDLAAQGDSGAEIFNEIFSGLEQAKPRAVYPEHQLEQWSLEMIQPRVLSQIEQMPGDRAVKYLPALNSWMTQALGKQNLELDSAVGTQVLISTFAGEAGASQIAEWRDQLDDDVVNKWQSGHQEVSEIFLPVEYALRGWQGYYGDYASFASDIQSSRDRLLRAQRMVENMLKDPWIAAISKNYLERRGLYAIIEDTGIASLSEILPHREELVSASSRPAFRNWLDLSRIASGTQQLALLDRGIDAALDDRERLRAKWVKVNVLNDARQLTAAKSLFEEIRESLAKLAERDGDEELSESIREFDERFGE